MTTIEAINTIPDGLNSAARHVSDRLAYVEGRRRVNWADVHRLASEAAAGLVALGLAKGDRVAICAENGIDWIVAYHATVARRRCRRAGLLRPQACARSDEQVSAPE